MQKLLILLNLIKLLFSLIAPTLTANQIHCPLKWIIIYRGSGFPEHAVDTHLQHKNYSVPTNTTQQFITRRAQFGSFVVDTVNKVLQTSNHNYNGETPLEILTNPFNCTLKWIPVEVKMLPLEFLVTVGTAGSFIGSRKSLLRNTTINLPCSLRFNPHFSCLPTTTSQNTGGNQDVFILKSSIQPKLQVGLHTFILSNTSTNHQTILVECDRLRNKGQGEISQLVTHSTEISNKINIALEGGISLGVDAQVEVELAITLLGVKTFFGSLSLHLGLDLSAKVGGDYTMETRTLVSSSQRITLPAETMVEACSSATVTTSIVNFQARAKASHPFLGGEEIINLLENDDRFIPPFNMDGDGSSVVGMVKGGLKIVEPLSTDFIVQPINYFSRV